MVEVGRRNGSVWKIGGSWNYWKIGKANGLWRKERIKEKEKGKEIHMRRYFLGREFENNESGRFPGFSCRCGNLSGKHQNRPKFKYLGTTHNNHQKSRI